MEILTRSAAVIALVLCAGAVNAEWRCDCTQIVDSCNADVSIQGNWVEVTSDHKQCARVDYFIDGVPFVALVVDGVERQDWIARTEQPGILVQSCQVCRDNASSEPVAVSRQASPAQGAAGALTPIIEVSPTYPAAAQAQGLEGYVGVRFTVTPSGMVQDPVVTESEPALVFDDAAVAAVRQWRFLADESRSDVTIDERIEFDLSDYILRLPARANQASGSAQGTSAANACVRERSAYNYGDLVEVGLMNACTQPLLVFSCAQGTGRYDGRWACADTESRRSLLVPPGDPRVGTIATVQMPAGGRAFRYEEELLVTRAPNSEYWWLACVHDDSRCREMARLWLRSMDRQLASIDPQSRASRTLARSY